MATIRKPKMKKYPKKPKMSAGLEVKQNFLVRCKDVDNENTKRMREYDKKITERANRKKKAQTLDKKISGIGRAKTVRSKHKR